MNLEKVAEILGAQESLQPSAQNNEIARLRQRQQKLEHWGGIAGLSTFGLVLLTMIIVVFSQMIIKGRPMLIPGALLILLAIGAGAMGLFQTYSKSLKEKLSGQPLPPANGPAVIEKATTFAEPVASITDRTTSLLEPRRGSNTKEIGG